MSDALSTELEAALLRALVGVWHDVNAGHFRRKLKVPTVVLAETVGRLGAWKAETRTIELSRALVLERPWGVVVEVLKHEIAHQYVHEVLGVRDESAHGPAFREVCARAAIDASAAGLPEDSGVERPRVLQRVAKLLALAESPNVHEAQLAMAEAQRLMLRHNLEAAPGRGYGHRHLGEPTGAVGESDRLLAVLLSEHFFVEVIWVPVWRAREGKRGSVLEVCGTPENLDIAAYVHGFMRGTAERLWKEYRRERGIRSNRERRTYLSGVMIGFREKLEAQKAQHAEQGLVWVGDADLHGYYRKRHPHIRFTHHSGSRRSGAHADGREAGRNIVLHRGVSESGGSSGRLLGPGR